MQKTVIVMKNQPAIISSASVVGKKEYEGPHGDLFDFHDESDTFGAKTWEQSEAEMQKMALNFSLSKAKLDPEDTDIIFAGDLINQCTSSSYGLNSFDVPFLGVYGACSTMAETLLLGSVMTDGGYIRRAACITSSHNCTAERQFRYPIEYGSQRTPTSQWTVTGSAAIILGDETKGAYITEVMPGRIVDWGVTDICNMGAAMAPAAIDTLTRFFAATKTSPADFDRIITGDLGFEGYGILTDFLAKSGVDIKNVYEDCGLEIFDREGQDMHAGGSGCGCGAVMLASYYLPRIMSGELKEVLFMATGALMSPMTIQQGLSIPAVAHLIHISHERKMVK